MLEVIARRLFALLVVTLAVGAGLGVYALRIDRIRVTGLHTLSPRTVVRASGLEPGERILWIRLSAAERGVEAIPAVASARAERVLPTTVVIHVTERVPVARLDGARDLVADRQGVVFPSLGRSVGPVLYGWHGRARPGTRLDERSREVLSAFPGFPRSLRYYGRRLVIGRDSLVLVLLGGTQLRFGDTSDLVIKARVALEILRAERGHRLAYVDVSSPSVPVSRRRQSPTPAPSRPPITAAATPASTPVPSAAPPSPSPASPEPSG